MFIVNLQNIMCKIIWPREPSTKMLNMCCVAGLSSLLSVYLIHKATGNWRGTLRTITTYPALVLFPIVGFFTFGKVQDKASQPSHGLALSWKWTFVNMLMSLGVATVLHVHDMEQINLRFLYMSVQTEAIDSPGSWWHMGWSQASYIRDWTKDLVFSAFLMVLLFCRKEPVYGVLLADLPEEPHVMTQDEELQPLVVAAPAKYTRQVVSFERELANFFQVGTQAQIYEAPDGRTLSHCFDHRGTSRFKGITLSCQPRNWLLVANPEVGNSEYIHYSELPTPLIIVYLV